MEDDHDGEPSEGRAQVESAPGSMWAGLFTDLIMVCACANVADTFEEAFKDGRQEGEFWSNEQAAAFRVFVVVFMVQLSGWQMLTMISCRLVRFDGSVLRNLGSLGYFFGTATLAMESRPCAYFLFGCLLQRVCIMALYCLSKNDAQTSVSKFDIALTCVSFLILTVGLMSTQLFSPLKSSEVTLWLLFVHESLVRSAILTWPPTWIEIIRLYDYEQLAERKGCMTMVVLGESVVSSLLSANSVEGHSLNGKFYWNMALTLLVTYTLAVFYFVVQPPSHSIKAAPLIYAMASNLVHYGFLASLLCMGVGIKFVSGAIQSSSSLLFGEAFLLIQSFAIAVLCISLLRWFRYKYIHRTSLTTSTMHMRLGQKEKRCIKRTVIAFYALLPLVPLFIFGCVTGFDKSSTVEPTLAMLICATSVLFYLLVISTYHKILVRFHRSRQENLLHGTHESIDRADDTSTY